MNLNFGHLTRGASLIFFLLLVLRVSAQDVVDPCFNSVAPGADFTTTADVANSGLQSPGVDLVTYANGAWTNTAAGSNLNVDAPYACDVVRAAFFQPSNTGLEALGLRLTTPLNLGAVFTVDITGISHGAGSDGNFEIQVYSSAQDILYNGEQLVGNGPLDLLSFGNAWEQQTATFTVPFASDGHQWIFLVAPESSGLLSNLCQEGVPTLEYTFPSELNACAGETIELGDVTFQGAAVSWNTGQTTPFIDVTETGIYSFDASNACNTLNGATQVNFFDDPELVPENDTTICNGSVLEMRTEGVNATNLWSDGSTDSLLLVSEAGMYGVTVTDDCGTASYMIEVSVDSLPVFDLGNDTVLCADEPLTLNAAIEDEEATYLWSDGTTLVSIEVVPNTDALYTAEVTNACGTASDAISVAYSLIPEDALAGSYELCLGVPLQLDVSFIEGTYTWKDGSTGAVFQVPSPGIYWVSIEDDDGCWSYSDTTVTTVVPCDCPLFMPNAFSPNNDGINDTWGPVYDCEPYDFTLKIIDRWGRTLKTINDPTIAWDGNINGAPIRDGIYVYQVFYREVFDGIPITKTGHVVVLQD